MTFSSEFSSGNTYGDRGRRGTFGNLIFIVAAMKKEMGATYPRSNSWDLHRRSNTWDPQRGSDSWELCARSDGYQSLVSSAELDAPY